MESVKTQQQGEEPLHNASSDPSHMQNWQNRVKQLFNSSLVAAALLVLIVIFSIVTPTFLSQENIATVFDSVAVIATLSVGQAFVIITAGIDLSQGAVVAISGVIGAAVMVHGGIALGILAFLAVGVGVGLFNGFLVAYTKVPAFIVTLGSLSICSGGALLFTGGEPIYNLPSSLVSFGTGAFFGVFPYIILVTVIVAIAGQILLGMTRFGRSVYAIGSNQTAALLSGLSVRKSIVLVYLISGVLSAIGGLMLTAYVNTALPTAGANFELDAIAAVVIGGGSLFGGQGSVWAATLGALLLSVLSNGTQLLGMSSYAQILILGVVVIGAVYIDSFRKRGGI